MAKFSTTDNYIRPGDRAANDPVTLNATEARQGSWGRPVFYVLVVGLILAVIAWWAAEYYGSEIAPPTDPATTSSVAPDPAVNSNTVDDNQPANQPVQKAPATQDSSRM